MADTYRRRQGPVDACIPPAERAPLTGPMAEGGGNDAADRDYRNNLRRFQWHDDMAAEPTRDKSGEPQQKP